MSTLSEIDNVLLNDSNLSVGTIIKRKAIELFNDGTTANSRDYKIMTNGLSSTLDICDITESSQKSLFKDGEWEYLVKTCTKKYDITLIPVYDLILSTWKVVTNNITNTRDIGFGLKYLYQIFPKHLKKQHFFCLKLCEHMINLIHMHPAMLIKADPHAFSENDYLRVVWSDFFEYLFPASGNIKIKTGETTYYKSAENKSQLYAHLPNTSKIVGFKIDLRLLFRHNNRDIDICAGEIASHDGDSKIIDDEGKLNRESKDILDNLISIIPRSKSNVSMGWSIQIGGSSCFFSGIHLDADGLYLKVPKFQFALPTTIADLDKYTDVLSKLLTFRKSMYSIADAIEDSLATKHFVETVLGRANNDEASLDPRIYWIRDSYYTPPSNTKPALPTYLFGCAPPSSIFGKLLSLSYEKKQDLNPTYKDCVFDENGWTYTGDHWFNTITNDRSTSSPYKTSDNEEDVTSSSDNPIPDSDTTASEFDTVTNQDPDIITQKFDTATRDPDTATQNSGTNTLKSTSGSRAQTYQGSANDKNDFGLFWRQMESNSYKETGYTESCIDWVELYLSQAVNNSENLTEESIDSALQIIRGYLLLANIQNPKQVDSKMASLKHLIKYWKLLFDECS